MVQEVVGVLGRVGETELSHLVDKGNGDLSFGEPVFEVFLLHQ